MLNLFWIFLSLAPACTGETTEPDDSDPIRDDTGDTQDSGDDTGEQGVCPTPKVTFIKATGATQDLTSFFTSGQYITLSEPGRVEVCPGEWFARVLLRADVDVVGLGETPQDTVLSGGEAGTILDVTGPDVTVHVQNLTLEHGVGLDPGHNSGGGGLYCDQEGVVFLEDLVFTNNFANDGSGLYARDQCVLDLKRVTLHDNLSEDDGGAVTLWNSTATFTEVLIQNNVSLDGGGMAMFQSELVATDLQIKDNRASNFGGGLWAHDSVVTLTDSELSGNANDGTDYGGGMIIYGTATLTRVSFLNNTAPLGGGLFVYYKSVAIGTDCDFAGNSPQDIFSHDSTGPDSHGGISYSGSMGYSFACSDNACTSF